MGLALGFDDMAKASSPLCLSSTSIHSTVFGAYQQRSYEHRLQYYNPPYLSDWVMGSLLRDQPMCRVSSRSNTSTRRRGRVGKVTEDEEAEERGGESLYKQASADCHFPKATPCLLALAFSLAQSS